MFPSSYPARRKDPSGRGPSILSSREECRWHSLTAGRLKTNIDVARVSEKNGFGVGIIVRDVSGDMVVAQACFLPSS